MRSPVMTTTRLARLAAWFVLAAAVVITLGPPRLRPATGLEHHLEHVLAFAVMALIFAIAYPSRRIVLALAGVTIIALLETFQIWSPGRHASLSDFAVNTLGLCVGLAGGILLQRNWRGPAP
jgi:VanZ family protein